MVFPALENGFEMVLMCDKTRRKQNGWPKTRNGFSLKMETFLVMASAIFNM
jgi:hypothetical protein